jgi:hypothetical protein
VLGAACLCEIIKRSRTEPPFASGHLTLQQAPGGRSPLQPPKPPAPASTLPPTHTSSLLGSVDATAPPNQQSSALVFRKPCRPADEWPAASTEAPCSWGSYPLGSGPRRSRNGPADAQQPDARCCYPRCREPSEPFIHPPAGSLRCLCLGVQKKRMAKVQRGLTPRLRRRHDRNESPSGEGF